MRPKSTPGERTPWVVRYLAGESAAEIGASDGRHKNTVLDHLRCRQIPIRGRRHQPAGGLMPPDQPFVVKIQRSLSHPGAPALLYDRERKITKQLPWEDVRSLFQPTEPKIYCRATLEDGKVRLLNEKVPDPGW